MNGTITKPVAVFGGASKILGDKNTAVGPKDEPSSLRDLVAEAIGPCPDGLIEPFGGGLGVAGFFKGALGIRVTANDWRRTPWYCGQVLVQNDAVEVTEADVANLQTGTLDPGPVSALLKKVLGERNALEFDRVLRNMASIVGEDAEMRRHIAFYGLLHVLSEALNVYHLRGATRDCGAAGNEHIHCVDLISAWRHWVLCWHPRHLCCVGAKCEMLNEDAVGLMRKRPSASCLYLDPPYARGNYSADLKVFEDLCWIYEGHKPGDPIFKSVRNPPHRFDNRTDFLGSMTELLLCSTHIPRWVISLNTTSPVKPEELALIARSMGRSCDIRRYAAPRQTNSTRYKPDDNEECLLVCVSDPALEADVLRIRSGLKAAAGGLREDLP